MPLTVTSIRKAKPVSKPFKLFDERGLFLLVTPAGGKLWRFKYRFGGKEKLLALGAYPDVSLAVARERREASRKLVATGIDPAVRVGRYEQQLRLGRGAGGRRNPCLWNIVRLADALAVPPSELFRNFK